MHKKRILFLGETYRADAITWMEGLKEFGDFEIVTWELKTNSNGVFRIKRILELLFSFLTIRRIAKKLQPDMVIAERTTSYGFLATLCGVKPIAIAQQGISDLWPEDSPLFVFKKIIQNIAFRKANLIHAWGPVMTIHMNKTKVDKSKIMVLPKGINLDFFKFSKPQNTSFIKAIVTRSLLPEYMHDTILKAFAILKEKNIPFQLTIVGDGVLLNTLKEKAKQLDIEKEVLFTGRIANTSLPVLLQEANFYISMPTTEGVSASLFEAMACGCYPIVTNIPGNESWITSHNNGILVPSGHYKKLAEEILWASENEILIQNAIQENRKFVEKNANYAINMKTITIKYHELIANIT